MLDTKKILFDFYLDSKAQLFKLDGIKIIMQFSQILAFQCKCLIMQYIDTYKFPFLYFDLGHMFDGVPATDSRVYDTEPPLPQHWTNLEKRSDIWTFFVV